MQSLPIRGLSLFITSMTYNRRNGTRHVNPAKHFVAKLVKSFDRFGDSAESLDVFRYAKASF
jgi:hypothetical protein